MNFLRFLFMVIEGSVIRGYVVLGGEGGMKCNFVFY